MTRTCILPLAAAILAGCAAEADPRPSLTPGEIEFERPAPSGEPHLALGRGGRVFLTWIEADGEGDALRLAIRDGEEWSARGTVYASTRMFVNWADFPSSVEMPDGTIAAHWLEKVAEAPYAYHVMLALSSDDGATWGAPFRAHDDDSPTEHGFASMVPWRDGAALVWLDGRAMASAAGVHAAGGGVSAAGGDGHAGGGNAGERGAMTLRFRTLSPKGDLGPEMLLDERTCECCQTSLTRVGDGLVAAYRDRGASEVRDIAVVRGAGGAVDRAGAAVGRWLGDPRLPGERAAAERRRGDARLGMVYRGGRRAPSVRCVLGRRRRNVQPAHPHRRRAAPGPGGH